MCDAKKTRIFKENFWWANRRYFSNFDETQNYGHRDHNSRTNMEIILCFVIIREQVFVHRKFSSCKILLTK